MTYIKIHEALEMLVAASRYVEAQLDGSTIRVDREGIDLSEDEILQTIQDVGQRYQQIKKLLTGSERMYGVATPENVAAIQRTKIELNNILESSALAYYFDEPIETLEAAIEKRIEEDVTAISRCLRYKKFEKNYSTAEKSGLSPLQISERTRMFRTVGYMWGIFKESPWKNE